MGRRESEAGTFAERFGGEERFEGVPQCLWTHPDPGVGHSQQDDVTFGGLPFHILDGDGKDASVIHGITGIDGKVEKDLFQLAWD